jgi:hypothetical protein
MTSGADSETVAPLFTGDGRTLIFQSWAADVATNSLSFNSSLYSVSLVTSGTITPFSVVILPANSGHGPTVNWSAAVGRSYQVQFKNDLADPDWQTVSGNIVIIGSQGSFTDRVPLVTQRFYRVMTF